MADPFTIEPPRWLQEIAKPVDGTKLGESIAMGFGTLVGSLEKDQNAPEGSSWLESRKGPMKALGETVMAMRDPQWRVHGQMLANQVQEQKMKLAESAAWLDSQQRETAAWMNELPEVSSYLTTPPEKLDGVEPPKVTSQKGISAITAKQQQIESYKLRKAQQDNINAYRQAQEENRRFQVEHGAAWQKHNQDVQEKYADLTPENRAAVDALGPRARNKDGSFTSEAEVAINQGLKNEGKMLIGQKPASKFSPEVSAQLTDLRADAADLRRRIAAAEKNGADTSDLEAELDGVKEQIRGLTGGSATGTPKSGSGGVNKLEHNLNLAKVSGDSKAIKAAEKAIRDKKKTDVLDAGGYIIPPDPDKKVESIAGMKPGTLVYDESTGKQFQLTQEMIDQANADIATKKKRQAERDTQERRTREELRSTQKPPWMGGYGAPM